MAKTKAKVMILNIVIILIQSICFDKPVLFPHKKAVGAQLLELRPENDVTALKNSILELEKEIYQDEQFNFHAKISIIFMTNSANTFALLDPKNLPTGNTAIDVWILRNQKVILSKEYDADSGLNWQFSTFQTKIKTVFQQAITVTTQDYNQVLVLRGGIFSFISFDSTETFSCISFIPSGYII